MGAIVTNNASATLASGINNSATTINVTGGQGALFPSPGASQYFYATLVDNSNNIEIVKCTSRSTDALTVTRAQEGTTARSYSAGDRIEVRPTAALLNEKVSNGGTALTNTRVPYANSVGNLVDSANLTFDGTTLTASGPAAVFGATSKMYYDDNTNAGYFGLTTSSGQNGDGLLIGSGHVYARVSSTVYLDISANAIVIGSTGSGGTHVIKSGYAGNYAAAIGNYSATPSGLNVTYPNAAPNAVGSYFVNCSDSGGLKAAFDSNGGLANYSANNRNLSDINTKENIVRFFESDELLKAAWEFGKEMSVAWAQYNYKDQTHDDPNNGYIAQYVAEAAKKAGRFSELVGSANWGTKENPIIRMHVYGDDVNHVMGVNVTQCQFKIDELRAEFDAYKATHP